MQIKAFLKQPYPLVEEHWKIIISSSLFISAFIVIFRPFELVYLDGVQSFLVLAGYGSVTFLALIFNLFLLPVLFPALFAELSWTVQKQIYYFVWILFTIAVGNYFYTLFFTGLISFSIRGLFLFQFYTLVIGIFPVTYIVAWTQIKYQKKNQKATAEINLQLKENRQQSDDSLPVDLRFGKGYEAIDIPAPELLFVEAMGNYIKVHFLSGGIPQMKIIRSSLREVSHSLAGNPVILQCHRAYIINLNNILKAEGNAQGYLLEVKGIDTKVPVSRKFIPQLKNHLYSSRKVTIG
jgi:hypothetical protein